MKKIIALILLALTFTLVACGQKQTVTPVKQNQTKDDDTIAKVKDDATAEQPQSEEKSMIELQGFNIIIPQGYNATGGHDGVKYINAIVTPKDTNLAYEIEVGYGIAATASDFESNMFVRGNYNDAVVKEIPTDEWKSKGNAYTFIRTHGNDSGAFTKFQADKGPSQVIGLYRDNQWLEAELRVISGSLADYPDVLAEFMSTAIDWQN